jgi:hypothetical protein
VGLELERDLELFFQKSRSKLSFVLPLCFLSYSFTSDSQRTFVTLQFAHPMTQKSLNLIKEREIYFKTFDDKYMFGDRWVLP